MAPKTRINLLYNRLVVIASSNLTLAPISWNSAELPSLFKNYVAMGDPSYVPAGIYAKEALEYFHWWSAISPHVIAAQDVRVALAFVARGEVDVGIVYKTDAMISKKSSYSRLYSSTKPLNNRLSHCDNRQKQHFFRIRFYPISSNASSFKNDPNFWI
ncbi:molybdate ABC transporter substrate-binding protein [Deltaproteobacteria bacterium TL4]